MLLVCRNVVLFVVVVIGVCDCGCGWYGMGVVFVCVDCVVF